MHSRDGVGNVTKSGLGWNPSMGSQGGVSVRGVINRGQDSGEERAEDYTRSATGLGLMGLELVLDNSFLIITHLIQFLVFLLMNPYPYVSLFFPFLYSRLTCFVTLLSQHNHIVLASYCVICSLEKCI